MEILNGILEYLVFPLLLLALGGFAAYSDNNMSPEAKKEFDRYAKDLEDEKQNLH